MSDEHNYKALDAASSQHLLLDRAPIDAAEEVIVNAYSRIDAVDEIWVRDIHDAVSTGAAYLLVYLGFWWMDPEGRRLSDNLTHRNDELRTRLHHLQRDIKVIHMRKGSIPDTLPARIWKRPPRIWSLREYNKELARKTRYGA